MAWRVPIVDVAAEYAEAGAPLEEAVLRVLRSGHYVLGPETAALEAELAALVGTRFAVGVGSGSDALALALRALGVGPDDEVVTTPFTYFATVEAILIAGARPVFADIEPDGFNLDPARVEAALTERTRAVLPVHLFGRCADMRSIRAIADARGIPVVEDAAQAIGAGRNGRRAGAWGSAGCFSFYPSKNLGGAGDGGCVTTDDADVAHRVRLLRTHGSEDGSTHRLVGFNSRLDSIQAAVLRAKLPYLKAWSEGRARNAEVYRAELSDCDGIVLPTASPDEDCVWNQYAVRCREPGPVRAALEANGIEWRHYYSEPAYRQPAMGAGRLPPGSCPEAERACAEVIALPVRPSCSAETIRGIARVIRGALGSRA
jgi:dTDP-4-amino-4,6-dideoxygalactose transaminase